MKRYWKRPGHLLHALAIGLAVPAIAVAATTTGADSGACDSLSLGHARNVCKEATKAAEMHAKTEAEAADRDTDKARARTKIAETDYAAAKAKCDALAGNAKNTCVKAAKASDTRTKADAKSAVNIAPARQETAEERRGAQYWVALEKCNPLADSAKVSCVTSAQSRYLR